MKVARGIATPIIPLMGGRFSPVSLFSANEPGGWYDPSDLTTMFQDAAGTTAAALESPVGLVLDKSKGSVGTNGAKRVNLLTWTEAFNESVWTKFNVTITSNAVIAPDGTLTADALFETSTTAGHSTYQTIATTNAVSYVISVFIRPNGRNYAFLRSAAGANVISIDLVNGVATNALGTTNNIFCNPSNNGFYHVGFTYTATASTDVEIISSQDGVYANRSYAGDITKGLYIWGADLRLASEASTAPTPYQRITADWASTMPGSHLSQSTSTARPVLSARVNLLTYSEQFDNAAWTEQNIATISAGTTTAPDGTSTAETITASAGAGNHNFYNTTALTTVSSLNYTVSVAVKKNTARYVYMKFQGTVTSPYIAAVFDLDGGGSSATQTATAASGSITSTSQEALGNGWFRLTMVGSLPQPTTYVAFGFAGAATGNTFDSTGNVTFTAAGTESVYIWGADLRPSNAGVGLPAYQRVGAATYGVTNPSVVAGTADYDATGFPYYLKFDGTDDFLVSGTISPGSVDKAQVFAGVRKLSDAAAGFIADMGVGAASGEGALAFGHSSADGDASRRTWFGSYKKLTAYDGRGAASVYASPDSRVIALEYNLAGVAQTDELKMRLNGTSQTLTFSTADVATGNFGNYPMYVGRLNGSSNPFSGNLYSLILRFSATNMDAATIASTETWVNQRTKAF